MTKVTSVATPVIGCDDEWPLFNPLEQFVELEGERREDGTIDWKVKREVTYSRDMVPADQRPERRRASPENRSPVSDD